MDSKEALPLAWVSLGAVDRRATERAPAPRVSSALPLIRTPVPKWLRDRATAQLPAWRNVSDHRWWERTQTYFKLDQLYTSAKTGKAVGLMFWILLYTNATLNKDAGVERIPEIWARHISEGLCVYHSEQYRLFSSTSSFHKERETTIPMFKQGHQV